MGSTKTKKPKKFLNSIIEVGTVSLAAKAVINALKAIPGINIGASVLNAIIAGSIVAALGEGSIYAFEQVYLGNKTIDDIDWVKKIIESEFSNKLIEKATVAIKKLSGKTDLKSIAKVIIELFLDSEK